MGYTHYWGFKTLDRKKGAADAAEKAYRQAVSDCQRVVRAYQRDAASEDRLSGYSAHTAIGKYAGLQINGKAYNGHESFDLREHFRQAREDSGKSFCKTARKPYDVVVVACLCILKYRLGPLFSAGSDGCTLEWEAGAQLASRVLDRKIKVPASIVPSQTLRFVAGGKE